MDFLTRISHQLRNPERASVNGEHDAGDYVLAIHLGAADPAVCERLPDEIEGHRIKYIYSGPFRKFSADDKV